MRPGDGEFDEELLAHGAEYPFDLATTLRAAWFAVGEFDAERRAGAQQLAGHERAAVVDVDALRQAAGGHPGPQCGLQADGVFAVRPPVADQRPTEIIDEGEQDRLAAGQARAVQRVAGPHFVDRGGFEPAEGLRWRSVRAGGQAEPDEMALHGAFVRRPARRGPQDLGDLRARSCRDFPFQGDRELQDFGRGAGRHLSWRGDERVEPATPPGPNPAVDGGSGHPDRVAERADVLGVGDRTDQRDRVASWSTSGRPRPGSTRSGTGRPAGPVPRPDR